MSQAHSVAQLVAETFTRPVSRHIKFAKPYGSSAFSPRHPQDDTTLLAKPEMAIEFVLQDDAVEWIGIDAKTLPSPTGYACLLAPRRTSRLPVPGIPDALQQEVMIRLAQTVVSSGALRLLPYRSYLVPAWALISCSSLTLDDLKSLRKLGG